ncbi:hypothetical protein CDG76_28355 [Nostoc sp. 'Peltigera membranacea cyanobiont' 210A]|uniref:hypothetical protein n=1 Tax=Nostoc sp. 'Peltigera membranacea cyanobiont' 210A TaxID=2014529 RepID=UPI000B957878|nr:hypothetical protein [Nostoc sp. 'Peltigera membranacea cyanobiont' 210A]OYD91165.1 hypothetical protein CDG76_28355 [Nostoc sp. 'Peltigera membranacea cyanobiont' 210A]
MTVLSSSKDDLFNLELIRSYVDVELNPRFVERHWLKQQVEDKLADPDCRFILLTAEPGAGKSAFMAWLAHQHPNWCRYFIRRDQRTPFSDVGSHSFLLQVGFQLAAIYPELFKEEQIKIVVEQRISTATDSNIVGAYINNMFASPFYKKVFQIKQQVTHSKDTNITGIHIDNFYPTERDLPPENLEFMALFDPAKAMMEQVENGEHPQRQIVVLVDALDELRYQDSELSLLKWLTNCPELPANLRFVLTCRPDDDLLRNFRGTQQGRIQEIEIAEEDPDVIQDLTRYTRFLIETPEVNQILIEMCQDLDEFTHQAVTKASGNFGYLGAIGRAVDKAIRQNQEELLRDILKLSELPDTLQYLYAFFLNKIKDTVAKEKVSVEDAEGEIGYIPVWSAVYKPILGILSVSLEPLTPHQIQKLGLIQAEFDYITAAIEKLQQFLDQVGNCYRLYHSTLPEFFISPKTKERTDYSYCYVDAVKQNQRIVNYYQAGAKSWVEVDLKKIAEDDYGRRHLAQHLVSGDRVEELHTLLKLKKDERNAWFDARKLKDDVLGFLNDVKLAWQIAEKEFSTSQSSRSIVLQCRYALITSSINRLTGKLRTELVIELARRDLDTGWAYFQQMVSKQNLDLEILSKLERQTPESEFEKKLLQNVEKFSDKSYQILVKSALIQYYHSELSDILETVKVIEKEKDKVQALKMLVPHLSWDSMQLSKILEVAEGISDEVVVQLLSILPQYFSESKELLEKVLTISQNFNRYQRGDVLIGLAPYLSNKLLKQALDRVLVDENEESQGRSLEALATAPYLNGDLEKKIRKKAESYKNLYFKTKVLSALLIRLTDQLDKAQLEAQLDNFLQKVQRFEDEHDKAQIMSVLAFRLPLDQLEQILQKVQTFEDEYDKAKILSILASRLPSDQLEQILQNVQTFKYEYSKVSVLERLANNPNLTSGLIKTIQQQAENFYDKDNKIKVLSALVMHLPQNQRETYFSTNQLVNILEEVQTIKDNKDDYQTNAIRYLLAQLPQQVGVLEEVNTLDVEYYKDLAKKEMTICLSSDQLDKILQEVEKVEHEEDKVFALRGIAITPNLEPGLIQKIQQQTESFQQYGKVLVLSALSKHWGSYSELINKTLKEANKIEDNINKAQVLSALASHLPLIQLDKVLDKLLQEIQTLKGEYWKVKVLSKLAFRLSQLSLDQHHNSSDQHHNSSDQHHNWLYKNHKDQIILTLAPIFHLDQLDEILEQLIDQILQDIQISKTGAFKPLALSTILPHLALDQIKKVLKVTQVIEDRSERADILRVLALELAKFPCDHLHDLWVEMLHILASRDRRSLLSDFRELTPVISSLGKDEAIVNICHAIKDIGRQWA